MASKLFYVPRSTLENYVNQAIKTIEDLVAVPLGRRPILGISDEEISEFWPINLQ